MTEQKKAIVYLEDYVWIQEMVQDILGKRFPNHSLIFNSGIGKAPECADEVINEAKGIEKIALVCTDGSLLNCFGWDVLEKLRDKGYRGKAIYVGCAILPDKFKGLYDNFLDKARLDEHIENLEID